MRHIWKDTDKQQTGHIWKDTENQMVHIQKYTENEQTGHKHNELWSRLWECCDRRRCRHRASEIADKEPVGGTDRGHLKTQNAG